MSLRLVPAAAQSSSDAHIVSAQATAHPVTGTHDTFRHGLKSAAQTIAPGNVHPLQTRLEKWSQTQQQLEQNMQSSTYGLAVPLRKAMEIKLVSENLHNPLIESSTITGVPLGGSSNLSLEILKGQDETLDAGDFMGGSNTLNEVLDVNSAMERSRGI
ncbi:uncharacterized protein I303_105381 [Kwoniella dejecticola CBS 10117]|uniref:Proteasome maturation protein n=1 Tax=Kwoniella dejecticola CBS 10117 TaxID=1296121 RepID=A0A1A6A2N4_9TREE|nr:proteasome maturation protein [Kwoniella dejecticola CBS 10117]OBR84316.1 proteasome maturation protein [Kwoniella dejecticola CBS 10117]